MDVYIMGIVFCPMNKEEQDADKCLRCRNFSKHEINNGSDADKRKAGARLYVACRYSGTVKKIYKSTKSKRLATVVAGEPLPPTLESNEEWLRLSR
mgnify:CR=1 FL=1